MQPTEFSPSCRSVLALKQKGLRRSHGQEYAPWGQFSIGPETKGIETPLLCCLGTSPMFSIGPETKGIETSAVSLGLRRG